MKNIFDCESNQIFNEFWTNQEISPQPETQDQPLFNQLYQKKTTDSLCPVIKITSRPRQLPMPKISKPNMLKNLIVTIRSWVHFIDTKHGKYLSQVWKYFKECKKINKSLAWIVFGEIKDNPEEYLQLVAAVPVLAELTVAEYSSLQRTIRSETALQLRQANLDFILKYRRVKNRQGFNNYFYKFIDELENNICFVAKKR